MNYQSTGNVEKKQNFATMLKTMLSVITTANSK